jgi:chemotaxis response regulator CheB
VTLRVVVVDDNSCRGASAIVSQHPALTLVGEASDGAEALDVIVDLHPIGSRHQMPELDGFQVVALLADGRAKPSSS